MPHHQHIIGIRISCNSLGRIQMKITLLNSIKKIKKLCSNSTTECVLPKMFKPRLKIPYRSKVIAEMGTGGNFSTHVESDYSL